MSSNDSVLAEYITQAQLATQLGKCQRTLKRWRALREGPRATLIGKTIYYHRADVQAWLDERRQGKRS